ncbi:MAG TPA: VOC family protein [Acidimicrobiales bacterium]|nr:VOC family protein [Acidimicrobiales bacterium]
MPTRLIEVVVDALDVTAQAEFWSQALGWALAEPGPLDQERYLTPPIGSGWPGISFVPVNEPKTVKNRLHFDLSRGSDQARTVERVLGLGAREVDIGQGDVPWVVLADPEGNEFCVLAEDSPGSSLFQVSLDASDPDAQARFWVAASGWQLVARESWGVVLRPPTEMARLAMGPPLAPKGVKNRLHLDVAPFPGDDQAQEVDSLIAAGASRVDIGQGEVPWEVLADPEGNEFCVLTPR